MALKRVLLLGLALVCLLGFLIFNWEYCQASTERQTLPAAQDGILDISNWDFAKQGMVELTGDWNFFWQQLLDPEQISVQPEYTINVPRSWNGQIYGNQTLPGQGYGTYRLIIRLDNIDIKTLGFSIPDLFTPYHLWENGKLLAEHVWVGAIADTVNPQYKNQADFAAPLLALALDHTCFGWGSALHKPVAYLIILLFALLCSLALCVRYAQALGRAEQIAQEGRNMLARLQDINRALEEKVQERTYELNAMAEKLNHEILERQEIAEKLKMHATTDALTGLFNRATGMALLVNQLNLSERNQWNLTICFADLDYLKQVNDKHGHQAGDQMIKAASQIIVDNIRESDSIFRMGGDEFIIIFPQCSVAEAAHIWARIQGGINLYNQNSTHDWSISISCGFAQYTPGSRRKVADLIKEADQEMYRYKTLYRKLDL